MTFDGNPKPVQFIEPNVLDRAARRLCRSIRIASHRTHSKFLTHGASPMACLQKHH